MNQKSFNRARISFRVSSEITGGLRTAREGRLLEKAIARTALPTKPKLAPQRITIREEVVRSKSGRGAEETILKRVEKTIVPPILKEWR